MTSLARLLLSLRTGTIAFLCLAVLCSFAGDVLGEDKQPTEKSTEATQKKEEPKASLIEIYAWTGIIPKELIDLESKISDFANTATIEAQLPELLKEIQNIQWEVSLLKAANNLQRLQTSTYDLQILKIKNKLNKVSDPLNRAITELSAWHKDWQTKKDTLIEYKKQKDKTLSLVNDEKKDLDEDINKALKIIEEKLTPLLNLGKKIGDMQVQIYACESDLKAIDADLRKENIQQTSPSLLSKDFYTRLNPSLVKDSFLSIQSFILLQLNNLKGNYFLFIFASSILVIIATAINYTRRFVSTVQQWRAFAESPIATTIFLASANSSFIGMLFPEFVIPREWEALLHIINILAVVHLLNSIVLGHYRRKILSQLSYFLAFTLLLVALNLPQTAIFFYVFYVALVALIIFLIKLKRRLHHPTSPVEWFHRGWGIFPLLVLLSGTTGYDRFAVFFFSAVLSTIVAFMIIWMLYKLNSGLIELVLWVIPVSFIKINRSLLQKKINPILIGLHIFLLAAVVLVNWVIYPTVDSALAGIANFGFNLGGIRISPGFIITILLVFYLGWLASQASQFLLLHEVLPHYSNEKGVQMSISRLVHYGILFVTFFILLRVLGFKLEQLTLLGGALGVGIGFGLQAIFNNFAGGLILLFERPVKVGDTIQLGNDLGEVKTVGLRATIIQTFDNAEIVIPNSDLVTGQVTNWTLANRKIRVKVPVGVAYGSNVNKVLELLRNCATANPMVLPTPKPVAFFLAFGASSLDFELRVWIPEFLDRTQVLSDLNRDIEAEFSINGIEIPFPQSDVHIRSIVGQEQTVPKPQQPQNDPESI